MSQKFWLDDFSVIYKKEYLADFFPTDNQTMIEKYNSIVRLCLYTSILTIIYNNDIRFVGIFVVGLLLTMYLKKYDRDDRLKEKFGELELETTKKCVKPTLDNPFMNLNYTEFDDQGNISREPACDPQDVKKEIDEFFNNNLYRDTSDLFGKMNSQRQFFTMPYTTAPNDPYGDFKNWLYKSPKTCKEDTEYCTGRNEDTRRNFKRS